jgi:hypothetical protein
MLLASTLDELAEVATAFCPIGAGDEHARSPKAKASRRWCLVMTNRS